MLERAVLARADRVVAVTAPIADDLRERLGREVRVITNGFDPEEAERDAVPLDGMLTPGRHSLVHTGRAGVSGRSPRSLLDGLAELRARSPETAERLEVVFAGPTTAEERELLADERLGGLARSVGALERPHALALQRAADSLLVVAAGASMRSVATNKLFEYLAARRPVLVLGDESEAARIVTQAEAGIVAPSDDPGRDRRGAAPARGGRGAASQRPTRPLRLAVARRALRGGDRGRGPRARGGPETPADTLVAWQRSTVARSS